MNINIKCKVISADGSNLGPIGVVICSLILDACKFECKFIVCKKILQPVILGLDFVQEFRVGID